MAMVNSFIELIHGQSPKSSTEYPQSVGGLAHYLNDHGIKHTSGIEMSACGAPKLAKQLYGTTHLLPERADWPFGLALAMIFDQVRSAIGVPASITSWYRPDEYNRARGGATRSDHLFARAIDIHFGNASDRKIGQKLIETKFYGFNELGVGLGIGRSMVHVSIFSPNGQRRWTYSSLSEPNG